MLWLAPVLADLRRVAIPPYWCVILLPSPCRLQDVLAALAAQCGPLLFVAAVYLNFDRAGQRPLGIHRHTVVTPVGAFPIQGYDLVATNGAFAPLCLRGCDVAALRSGLARFLAAPATLQTSTSTTTTAMAPNALGSSSVGPVLTRPQSKARGSRASSSHASASIFGRPLSLAGHTPTIHLEETEDADPETPLDTYTVFNAQFGCKIFLCEDSSDPNLCGIALTDTRLPGAPRARTLQNELVRLPGPQIAITSDVPGQHCRAVVLDLAPFGGDVSVHDMLPGQTILDLIQASNAHTLPIGAMSRINDAMCVCMVNHVITDAFRALQVDADVITFYLLRPASATLSIAAPTVCPPCTTMAVHPASAPLSPFVSDSAQTVMPLTSASGTAPSHTEAPARRTRFTARRIARSASEVVRLDNGEGRYTVIGTLEGAINRFRQPNWDAQHCLQDAVETAPRNSPYMSGYAVAFPLPGLWLPQIVVSRVNAAASWCTVAVDLRALGLGVIAIDVRVGTRVSSSRDTHCMMSFMI